jgi:hypothetical protein
MDTINLKRIFHRGKECVGLYFDNNPTLNNLVQKLTGVKWSQTNKCWYIPREHGWYNELKALTKYCFPLKAAYNSENIMLAVRLVQQTTKYESKRHF